MIATNITGVREIADAVRDLAYSCRVDSGAVQVGIPVAVRDGSTKTFPAIITLDEEKKSVVFSCQVCKLNEIADDNLAQAALSALSLNAEIHPFAFAILNSEDGISEEDPVVLIDSKPLGDFSSNELESALNSLRRALSVAVLEIN